MVGLTVVLVILYCLKFLAISNAVVWMTQRGRDYRMKCEGCHPAELSDFSQIFDELRADFLPFGFKDYRLRRFVANQRFLAVKLPTKLFQSVLFRYNKLTTISSLYAIVAVAGKLNGWETFDQPCWGLATLAVLMLLGNLALSVEAIVSYTMLGNYAVLFHMMTPRHSIWDTSELRIREGLVFTHKFLASIAAGTVAVFVTHTCYGSFKEAAILAPADIFSYANVLFDSLYFTLTTFLTVGYGDVSPVNPLGKLVCMLIMLQGFLLIVGVFASVQSSNFDKLTPD